MPYGLRYPTAAQLRAPRLWQPRRPLRAPRAPQRSQLRWGSSWPPAACRFGHLQVSSCGDGASM